LPTNPVQFAINALGDFPFPQTQLNKPVQRVRSYGLPVLYVVLATSIGWLCRHFLFLPDLAIGYLYVIVVAALLYGWGQAIVASALSVLAYDFFFVPPVLEFNIADIHYLFTFAMLFTVGLLVSRLATRIRLEQRSSMAKERRTAALYTLSRELGAATDELHVSKLLVAHTAAAFGSHTALQMPDSNGVLGVVATEGSVPNGADAQQAVAWVYKHGVSAGRGSAQFSNLPTACAPITSGDSTLGVLVVEVPSHFDFDLGLHSMLESLGRLGGVCIAGLRLAETVTLAEIRARAEATRSALLSTVSHDLRTPLAVITEAATMLRDDAHLFSAEQQAEMVVTVCDEAERMERLVANLLDMTRLDSGEITLRRDWVPCEELVGAALQIVRRKAGQLTIRTNLPPVLPLLSVDPTLMEQLLANLLENIAKYAGPQATVDIGAREEGNALVVEVADNGPGIPAGAEERIFEKFFRASPKKNSGTGLGLAICRAIIEIHGGKISASNRPTGGAVFHVYVPLANNPPDIPRE